MKYFSNISKLILVFLLPGFLIWLTLVQHANAEPPQLEEGQFLSQKYLEVLKRTRSPFLANGCVISAIVVKKDQNVTEVMPISNFHEGGPSFRIDPNGKIEFDGKPLNASHELNIIGAKEIVFGDDCCFPQKFFHVENMDELLNRHAMAGRYIDGEGRPYVFTAEGQAETPTRIFEYVVGTDHVPYQFDYFVDLGTHDVYRLIRSGCRLEIFKILNPEQFFNDGSDSEFVVSLHEMGCKGE